MLDGGVEVVVVGSVVDVVLGGSVVVVVVVVASVLEVVVSGTVVDEVVVEPVVVDPGRQVMSRPPPGSVWMRSVPVLPDGRT